MTHTTSPFPSVVISNDFNHAYTYISGSIGVWEQVACACSSFGFPPVPCLPTAIYFFYFFFLKKRYVVYKNGEHCRVVGQAPTRI